MPHDAKKTKKFKLGRLFRPTSSSIKEKDTKVSLSLLKKMAITKEQEDILRRIEHETISSVRDAWIDYFLELTKRSKCKSD